LTARERVLRFIDATALAHQCDVTAVEGIVPHGQLIAEDQADRSECQATKKRRPNQRLALAAEQERALADEQGRALAAEQERALAAEQERALAAEQERALGADATTKSTIWLVLLKHQH
jgi:hypothetical protein